MMAIESKPCYPKVIKFGRSGKRERRPQRRKKSQKRNKRKEINKQFCWVPGMCVMISRSWAAYQKKTVTDSLEMKSECNILRMLFTVHCILTLFNLFQNLPPCPTQHPQKHCPPGTKVLSGFRNFVAAFPAVRSKGPSASASVSPHSKLIKLVLQIVAQTGLSPSNLPWYIS